MAASGPAMAVTDRCCVLGGILGITLIATKPLQRNRSCRESQQSSGLTCALLPQPRQWTPA
jgi:hypothetical protein